MYNKNERYVYSENKGRKLLYKILNSASNSTFNITDWSFTDTVAKYDGQFKNNDKECVFELKYRQNSIDKYHSYLLEKLKYDELERHYIDGKQVYYIMLFKEDDGTNSAYIFDISRRIDEWGLSPQGIFIESVQPNSTVDFTRGVGIKLVTFLIPQKYDYKIIQSATDTYTFAEPTIC